MSIASKVQVVMLLCVLIVSVGCDRSPTPGEIEGVWIASEEACELLGLSGDATKGTMTFLPGGSLHAVGIPSVFVGSDDSRSITADGKWKIATDGSASITTILNVRGGQISSVLSVVKKDDVALLVVWRDEPGGQAIPLRRIRRTSSDTKR